ncbi:MAG: decarboxylating 6-phosphogluconate dehydrogenase [Gammaproteobacteria bacterium]|nr:decarboxylating 6-phosphogluconate dehydrogenase [Gammaproteobacteria bacterium]
MKLAIIGLGRMGGNMARRLRAADIEVVGYDNNPDSARELADEIGLVATESLQHTVELLEGPRVIWLMLPAGEITENTIESLVPMLEKGDIIIDGANSNYHDSQRRAQRLSQVGLRFVDAGVSGGVWGLKNGYCLMVGGTADTVAVIEPVLKALAPAPDKGWAHVGPVGSGHFTKMIHNGIEYGMMQAYGEGLALLENKKEFNLDMAQISELWRHGSVVQSWLLDLTAGFLQNDQTLEGIAPVVPDSGEGRWTVVESIDQGVAAPVISMALAMRFASQEDNSYGDRVVAMMRKAFGGHAVTKKD